MSEASSLGGIGAYTDYTVGLPTVTGSATANYSDTSTGVTLTGNVALNSLKLAPATTAQTIALGATNVLTFSSAVDGILYDNTNAASTISGTLAAGQFQGSASGSELIITTTGSGSTATNRLTISAIIGGGTSKFDTVTKAGAGTLVLSGANSFASLLRVNEGTVSFGSVAATATAQPTGAGSTITLGSGNKTGILEYTGGTDASWTKAISLAEGGFGQFNLTNASVTTLTVGGVISGPGGLIVNTPTTAGSGLIFTGVNTYLGTTTINNNAVVSSALTTAFGASGTLDSGTTIANGGTFIYTGSATANSAVFNEIFTIAGTGNGGFGVIQNNASTNQGALLKYVILSGAATIGSSISQQVGVANGFIKGNGNNLTFNSGFAFLTNDAIDNVPVISANGGLVIEKMTLTSTVNGVASSGHTLLMTGATKQIQLRSAVLDRATTWTTASGNSINFGNGDSYVSKDMTFTTATGSFDLFSGLNAGTALASLTFTGNLIGTSATNITIGAGATVNTGGAPVGPTNVGNVIFSGTGNVFGTLTIDSGTARIMPIGTAVTNPISSTANVVFTPITNGGGVTSPMFGLYLGLDNSKATGAVSQTFANLTTTNAAGGSTAASITLNNTTGQNAALVFGGTLARAAGSEILVNITGTSTTPSANNRIDIAGIGSNTISQGIFYAGSDYALRDSTGTAYLRPINYGADTAVTSQLVATDTALTTNAFTKITASRTAQNTVTVASLAFGNGGNLAIAAGQTVTVTSGGILKSGGTLGSAASVISGGTSIAIGNTATNSGEAIIRTDTLNDLLTINSAITVNGTTKAINKLGLGRLTLAASSSATLTAGTINIQEGTLRVTAATGGLGAAAVAVNINQAAALELDGSNGAITLANAFANMGINSVNTSGFMNQSTGSIRNIAGSNIITGLITHPGFTRINSDAGSLTFTTGGFSWSSSLNFGGNAAAPTVTSGLVSAFVAAGDIVINAPLSNATTARTVLKDGTGTLTFKPTVAHTNTLVDTFIIRGGTEIWDGGTVATNMFGTNSIVTMVGGRLTLKSGAGATTQTIATMSAFDGYNRLTTDTTAGGAYTFTMTSMAVPAAGTTGMVNFSTTGSYIIGGGTAAANNNGILGTAATNGFATLGNDWAVFNTISTALTGLGAYTALPTTGALGTINYSISTSTTLTASQLGNSLKADTSGGAVQLGLSTFNQTTNALLVSGGNNFTITGTGVFGSTTVMNYVHQNGSGNLIIDAPLADNSGTASVGWLFGGTGTGSINITSGGSINLTGTANTNPLAFQGGTIASPMTININGGAINFGGRGSFDVARNGGDNVVLTLNTGAINVAFNNSTTQFNVGTNSSSNGKFIQNGGTFISAAPVAFAFSGTTTNASGAAGAAAFEMHGGTFSVGGTTGSGIWTDWGGAGTYVGSQDGGTISLNRPGSVALFIGQDGTYGATASQTMTGGTLNVNGSTLIGSRNGAVGNFNIGGTGLANFYQGVILGLQDFAKGIVTQTGGTVNIGTGSNISDNSYIYGNNTIDLVLGYNQTTQAGRPSTTQGTYNLNGGELRVNGITTGLGNQYVSGADSASGTFTGTATAFAVTTTSGGTGAFNWGGGTLRPFDSDLAVASGITTTLTANSTLNSTDVAGFGRLVSFNSSIGQTAGSSFGLTTTGLGTVLLNAANTFTGGLTINGGIVRVGLAGALNNATPNAVTFGPSVAAGTKLQINGINTTVSSLSTNATPGTAVVENANGTSATLTVNQASGSSTFAGVIQDGIGGGALSLTKLGAGTQALSGANTYTGATTITAGTLAINGSTLATSAFSVGAAGTLSGSGTVGGATTVSSGGTITGGFGGSGALTLNGLTFSGSGTINVSNVAGGASSILNAGALTASGAINSVTINVGAGAAYANNTLYTLVNYTGGSIGGTGNAAFQLGTVGGLSGRQTGSIDFSVANAISLNVVGDAPKWTGFDTGAGYLQNGGYNKDARGSLSSVWKSETLNAWTTTNWQLQVNVGKPTGYTDGDSVLFDDSVLTAGRTTAAVAGAVFTAGSPVVTVTNTAGLTVGQKITGPGIADGTTILSVDSGTQITLSANTTNGNGTDITVGDGTTAQTLYAVTGTISGSTTVDISNGNVTPTSVVFNNTTAANYTLTTSNNNGIAGSTSLVKNNTGTVTINTPNSFTGGVQLNGGMIVVGSSTALGAATNVVAFGAASSAILRLNSNSVTLGGLTGDGTATVENGGSVTDSILTINIALGVTNVFGGVMQDGSGGKVLALTGLGSGTLVLTGANTYTGGTTISSGTLQIGNSGTSGSIVGNVSNNGSLIYKRTDSVGFGGTVSGTGTVTIASGTLVLTGSLSNSGTNSITSGAILQVGDTINNGSLGNVTDNGALNFNLNGTPLTYSGTVTGTGTATVQAGTLVLTGTLGNNGATTINNLATLQVGNGTISGTLGGNITDNGTLSFNIPGTLTYANAITGTGAVKVTNSGSTVIFSGGNSYSGGTIVSAGATLQLGSGSTTGSITGDVAVDGNLTINRSGSTSFAGNITGAGSFNLTGTATVNLTGTGNTFSGGTNIQRGVLRAGATNTLSANSIVTVGSPGQSSRLELFGFNQTVKGIATAGTAASQLITNNGTTNDAVLTLNSNLISTYGGAITNGSTKKLGITLVGGHTLILSGLASANTFTGVTAVQSGTLKIGATNAGTSLSVVTLGSSGTVGALDLNGFSGTIGGLATDPGATQSSQVVGNSISTANTLTLTPAAATSNIFGGVIADNFGSGTGTTAITLNGATTSVQVLTGTNTFTGTLTLTQGVLQVGNAGTSGTLGAGATTIASTATLLYNRTDTYTMGSGNGITGAGAITLSGGGTLATSTTDSLINTTGALNFGNGAGATVVGNFAVNGNAAVGSLLAQTNSATASTISIASGKTLTVNGNVSVGFNPTIAAVTNLTMNGGGAFNEAAASGTFQIGGATGAVSNTATLDMSGLGSTNINVGTGTVRVNNSDATNLSANVSTWLLPTPSVGITATTQISTITAANFNVGDNASYNSTASPDAVVQLGSGLNTINATNVNIGTGTRDIASLTFNSNAVNGAVKIRASDGASRAVFNLATGSATTTATTGANNLVDFTGHNADLLLSSLNVGNQARIANLTSTFAFDTGVLDTTGVTIGFDNGANASGTNTLVSNVNIGGGTVTIGSGGVVMGAVTDTSTTAKQINGNFNVSGGTVTIGATAGVSITLGNNTAASGLAAVTDSLNLTGGVTTVSGDIVAGTVQRTTANLVLNGGTLDMGGFKIGGSAAANNLTSLTFASGTLRNVAEINNGAALTKTTAGTLILDGTNAFTGGLVISQGVLKLGSDNVIPDGATSGSVSFNPSLGNSATLDLNGHNDTINGLSSSGAGTAGINNTSGAGTYTLTVGGNNQGGTFAGSIQNTTGAISLTKTGSATQVLSGTTISYSGATTVSAGTLSITGGAGAALTTNALTVAGGATFNVVNNAGWAVNLGSGAINLGAGAGTTTLGFELGSTSAYDSFNSTAAATTTGSVLFNLTGISGFGLGTYNLLTATSGLDTATYTVGSLTNMPLSGISYTLTKDPTFVRLTTAALTGNLYWRGGLNSSWSAVSNLNTNFTTDLAGLNNAHGTPGAANTVIFSATSAVGPTFTTTLDGSVTANNLLFTANPTGVTSFLITSGTPSASTLTIAPASVADGIGVAASSGSVSITAGVVLGSSQTWSVDGTGASLNLSGGITGAGGSSLTLAALAGSPTITLSGSNTYSGATTIGAGMTLMAGGANGLPSNSALTVNGTLATGAFASSITSLVGGSGIVQNGSATNAVLSIGNNNTGTNASPNIFGGTLQNGSTGTLGITKIGTGVQSLTGTYSYTGATTINAGTLRLGGTSTGSSTVTVNNAGSVLQIGSATGLSASNAVSITASTTLDLFGNSVTIGALTNVATATITNTGAGTGASTTTTPGSPALTDALTISPATAAALTALITDGPTRKTQIILNNALTNTQVTGNTANTFSGGLVLANNASGTRLTVGTVTGTPWGAGPIIIGQAATDKAGIFFSVANQTLANDVIFNTALGTDRVGVRIDATSTMSGKITANLAPATFTSNTSASNGLLITGQITGAFGLVLDINSLSAASTSFAVTLNNAGTANDYAGDTVINFAANTGKSVTLNLGAANQLPNGAGKGNVVINTSGTGVGTLNMAGFNETINGLSGNGTVDGASGTPTLTFGDGNATGNNFSGVIQNSTGTLSVTKIGSGTQTLSGTNTFTGALNVSGGTLSYSTSTNLGGNGVSHAVNITNGAALSYNGAGSTTVTADQVVFIGTGGGTLDASQVTGVVTYSGGISNTSTGDLTKTGSGSVVLSGTTSLNSGAGSAIINAGKLTASFGTGGISALTVGATGNMSFQNSTAEILTLAGALTLTNGARLGFDLGAAGTPGTSDQINSAVAAVVSGTITLDFTNLSGFGAGSYNLISAASGLSNASYVLGSGISGFKLVPVWTDTLVSLNVTPFVPIYWRGGQNFSWNTLGAATANWTTDAAGTLDATSTPQSNATVIFSATGAPFSAGSQITTTLDAAFTIDSLQFTNVPGTISAVTINPGSGGTLTLAPVSNVDGIQVQDNAGVITIAAPLTAATAQTWSVTGTGNSLVVSGNTTLTGSVTKTGAGALTISGTNAGAGGFSLIGGTLNLGSSNALGTGSFTIGSGVTMDATGASQTLSNGSYIWNGGFTFTGSNSLDLGSSSVTLGGNVALAVFGSTMTVSGAIDDGASTFGLTKSGLGTLVLNGANGYDGLTTVNGGVLTLAGDNSGAAGGVTLSAGTLNINQNNALGTGTFTIAGGATINNSSAGAVSNTTDNNVQIWNGSFTFTGTQSLNLGAGAVTLGATLTITTSGATKTLTVGGVIDDGINTFGIVKDGAGTLSLGGVNTYSGTTTINNGALVLTANQSLTAATNTLIFGTAAGSTAVGTLNLTNASATFGGATTVQTNSASANTITIGSGQTLRLNGAVTLGFNSAANTTTKLTVAGATSGVGTLTIGAAGQATNADFVMGANVTTNLSNAVTLDMNTLGTFYANLGSGTFRVGDLTNAGGTAAAGSTLTLAASSTIIATTITSSSDDSAVTEAIKLGTGANTFNTTTIEIGAGGSSANPRSNGTLDFFNTSGSLTLRGLSGSGRVATFNVANSATGTGASPIATVNLAGHSADLLITNLTIGGRSLATTGSITGTFSFDTGTLDATTVTVATRTGSTTTTGAVTGTLNLMQGAGTTGTATIGTLNMAINSASTATTSNQAKATLNIGGSGTVNITTMTMANDSIGGAATAQTAAPSESIANISGSTTTIGTLNMNLNSSANTGTGDTSLSTLNVSGGTLSVGTINMATISNANAKGTSTINISGTASVTTGAGGINMANASVSGATTTSIISITGGSLTLGGNISYSNAAGTKNTTLTLNGGLLNMGGFSIGDAAAPVGSGTGALNFQSGTLRNVAEINGGGTLNKSTAGTLLLDTSNGYTGQTTITAGVLQITNGSALGTTANGTTVAATGAALEISNNITTTAEAVTLNGTGVSNGGALRSTGGTNTYAGNITLASASRINADAGSTLTLDVASGNAITSTDQSLTLGGAGNIVVADAVSLGAGGLTKDGTGTATLTATNTYAGNTVVSGGTLQLGNGGTSGSLNAASAISVSSGATFAVNQSDTVTQGADFGGAAITGAGGFTQAGTGTTVLNAANSYNGATTVSAGTLQVGDGTSGSLTGTGTVTVTGTGTKLSGSGSIAGSTVISSGAVLAPGVGVSTSGSNQTLTLAAATSTLTVNNGGKIELGITSATYQAAGVFTNGVYNNGGNTYTTALSYLTNVPSALASWNQAPGAGASDFVNLGSGSMSLGTGAGTITILQNGYNTPTSGDVFNLIDWGSFGGSFNAGTGFTSGGSFADFVLPDLTASNLAWDTSAFTTYGILVVVPEPSRALFLMLGLLGLMFHRRRRSGI